MKNLFAVLLASLMLFSFAACSSETDSSSDTNQSNVETVTTDEESGSDSTEETTDETDSETGTDASDETGTDAADETGSDAADETGSDATDETGSDATDETDSATNTGVYTGTADPAEEQTITGTILDATMSTVTIQTEDGEELSFSIPDDADETEVDGMTVGDTLEITYTGTIDGTDTSGATVVKLVQTSAE